MEVFLAAAGVKGKIPGTEPGLLSEDGSRQVDKAPHLRLVNKNHLRAPRYSEGSHFTVILKHFF